MASVRKPAIYGFTTALTWLSVPLFPKPRVVQLYSNKGIWKYWWFCKLYRKKRT